MSDSQPSQTECKRKFEDSPTGILASRDRNLHETDAGALKEKIKRVFQFNNSSRVIPETPENTRPPSRQSSYSHFDQLDTTTTRDVRPPAVQRQLSLEEELQTKLDRMSTIANTLNQRYRKERLERMWLSIQVQTSEHRCMQLVDTVVEKYQRRIDKLKNLLIRFADFAEHTLIRQEKLHKNYTDIVHSSVAVGEEMKRQIDQTKQCYEEKDRQIRHAVVKCSQLRSENQELKSRNENINADLNQVKDTVRENEKAMKNLEMEGENTKMLLNISLAKLRQHELLNNRKPGLYMRANSVSSLSAVSQIFTDDEDFTRMEVRTLSRETISDGTSQTSAKMFEKHRRRSSDESRNFYSMSHLDADRYSLMSSKTGKMFDSARNSPLSKGKEFRYSDDTAADKISQTSHKSTRGSIVESHAHQAADVDSISQSSSRMADTEDNQSKPMIQPACKPRGKNRARKLITRTLTIASLRKSTEKLSVGMDATIGPDEIQTKSSDKKSGFKFKVGRAYSFATLKKKRTPETPKEVAPQKPPRNKRRHKTIDMSDVFKKLNLKET